MRHTRETLFFCTASCQVETTSTSTENTVCFTNSTPGSPERLQILTSFFFCLFFSSNEMKPQPIRVKTDFISRNHREITVQRGEVVEVSVCFCSIQTLLLMNPNIQCLFVRSCWISPSSGGKWGTAAARRDTCLTTSCKLLMSCRPTWWAPLRKSRTEKPNKQKRKNQRFVLFSQQTEVIPVLTRRSKPPDVKAWLEDKGFSPM